MTIANHLVVFFVCWWLIFFMVLPFGIQGVHESGEDYEAGIEPGAPVKANIGRKMLITTGITFIVWGMFWAAVAFDLIGVS
jgi:predicted secreted protein